MNLDTLKIQLEYTQWIVQKNCSDLDMEDSLIQPPGGGNCLNWLIGHLTASRQGMLTVLQQEPIWSEEKIQRYGRGAPPVTGPDDAVPLADMVQTFADSLDRIHAGLDAITPEQLAAKAPFSPANNENETVGSLLAGLVFHEAYHTGQTSFWRRTVGRDAFLK